MKKDPDVRRETFVSIIDDKGWNTKVFLVAASGFFTDSYNLFASNVILPSLAFVYFPQQSQTIEITINALTLAGSAVGQVLFGFLADKWGRQRLYGVELVIVIFTTLGLAASGPGFINPISGNSSINVTAFLMFWRFVMGIGIGAEYPLSACITAEWASTRHRAQMMSAVFLMQPLGQLCAYGVGLITLHALSKPYGSFSLKTPYDEQNDSNNAKLGIDILWQVALGVAHLLNMLCRVWRNMRHKLTYIHRWSRRIVAGVGGVPALIALLFRWTIPESGRYTCDIKRDAYKAYIDTLDGTTGWLSRSHSDSSRHGKIDVELGEVEGRDFAEALAVPTDRSESGTRLVHPQEIEEAGVSPEFPSDPSAPARPDDIPGRLQRRQQSVQSNLLSITDGSRTVVEPAAAHTAEHLNSAPILPSSAAGPDHVPGLDDEDEDFVWTQWSRDEWNKYFHKEGNWRNIFGVSVCWFCLDYVFYGLGFNNPGTLSKLWTSQAAQSGPSIPTWLLNSGVLNQDGSIFSVLNSNGIESIVTVSIWSLLGCALLVVRINFIDRRYTLIWTSVLLAVLLLATGIAFPSLFHKPGHPVLIVLYAVIQFFFSYGPNSLLFVIPAEIFPTRYRCTCYGIAAGAGKIGAVMMQLTYMKFDHERLKKPNSPDLGNLMYIFAAFMLLVAIIAWLYVPRVQTEERGARATTCFCIPGHPVPNNTLEELAEGREKVEVEDRVGFKERIGALRKRLRN